MQTSLLLGIPPTLIFSWMQICFFFASQISIECRKVTSKPRPCALLPGWSRSVSFQPCSWSFTLFLNTLETWRTLHECKADVRVAVLSLTKHVFVVMSQPHRSLKPHLVSHVNSVLGGGPLRSFQDLHHLCGVHREDFSNLVSGQAHHTSRAADFLWEDAFGARDVHGCAGRHRVQKGFQIGWTQPWHSPKNRQVTFVTLRIDPLFDLRYMMRLRCWYRYNTGTHRMHKERIDQTPVGIASLSRQTIFENSAKWNSGFRTSRFFSSPRLQLQDNPIFEVNSQAETTPVTVIA